jgi:hypothetical protein
MPSPATEGERGWEGTLSGERVERRLTALLAADVAGYSRLMGADAEGTLAAPKAIQRELVDPWIVEHRGPPCRDDHGGRDSDAAGRCRERWIRKRRNRVAVAATGAAGTSPSGALGMMSTPPPRDHRLYARGNALSKASGPAVDQRSQRRFTPGCDKVPSRRDPACNRTLHPICDHDPEGARDTAARDDIDLGSETFKGEHRAKLNSAESQVVKGNAGIWRISIDGFCASLLFTLSWPCFRASPWE